MADNESLRLPFSNYVYPRVWAHDVGVAFLESQPDPEETKRRRAEEYRQYQNRSHTHKHTHKLCTSCQLATSSTTGIFIKLDILE